ncbi:NAD(P)-dependent oxidoreductase [Arthrobacter sedimenti]|uniref:NAD(P)-dependent oxidoreductase n=1 Tax=Arthrobacter sedimenti TaxID=2694931 RepID=UPI0014246CCF|nr:NAD(P)-dependent oxidoreductase [Arthrobacter sedimenti]
MVTPSTSASLFVGLGNMGRPMAINYSPGRELFVYDTNLAAAADVAMATNGTALPNLENIPPHIGTVILMLPTSRIVESVLRNDPGLFSQLAVGSLIIDMSSSDPESTTDLAAEAAELGIDFVDAPVSGGVSKADAGKLAIMAGGESTAVERAKSHLRNLGEDITHTGPAGTGHVAKALNNLLSATNLAAAAEILTIAATAGITPETMLEVINGSTGRSQATEFKYPRHILTGTFDSGFAMDLMVKDLRIARDLISRQSAEAPVVLTAQQTAEKARDLLESASPDHTEFARYYEKLNGSSLRAS